MTPAPDIASPSPAVARACPDDAGDPEPPQSGGPLAVDVVVDEADWSAFGDVEAAVLAAAAVVARSGAAPPPVTQAVVALSSDAEVAALNATYRGHAKPTNVLSFPAPAPRRGAPDGGCRLLGDVIIARETVLAEAAEQAIPPRHHLQHLVVHGLLHLLGHDHQTPAEARAMEALEISLLAELGIPDPYGDLPLATDPD